ncbi:amino acid adenylation domain-containing protein [Actinosynnema sp. NPDC050801]|uniref:amino acid adenylation domain-containing protein n=1 Tax=unclassified Actinosynnema TaxID=2637065 RepID=UPI0033D363DC
MTGSTGAPLSFPQQRLWFLDQLLPGNTAYNISWAVRLSGPLDLDALTWSLRRIVERHEVLRTCFPAPEGEPTQVVTPAGDVSLPLTDLGALPSEEREAAARTRIGEEIATPFELTEAPPLRMRLFKLAEDDHVLAVVVHHILVDGWSTGLFFGELARLYSARVDGRPDPLAPLPLQYRDFARRQREELTGAHLAKTLDWWREHLTGAPSLLDLPTDRPRPTVQTFSGATHQIPLPGDLWRAVVDCGRAHKATPFMVLHTGLAGLLSRLTGATDLVIGSPVAGRARSEHEPLIGMFTNTLPLRVQVGGDPTVSDLLGQARATALGAFAHADLPFEKLVEELQPERVMSHNPLVQVMLTLQNTQQSRSSTAPAGTLGMEHFPMGLDAAFVDLWLEIRPPSTPDADDAIVRFVYKSDLFTPDAVARLAGHFRTLLGDLTARPSARLSELTLLDAAERAQVLDVFGAQPLDPDVHDTLPGLFERQAELTPDAIAVNRGSKRLTYAELNRRANRLAHRLRELGVGSETLVAICAARDVEMVVSTLAVLKAGGAYVPLDPTNPAERLKYVLGDTGARLLLTQEHLRDRFPGYEGRIVLLDGPVDPDDPVDDLAGPDHNPPSVTKADHLAYVIYTSGSTGRPKGVMIEHRQVVRLMTAADEHFDFDGTDVWALLHSHAFDLSVWEMWGAFTKGGRVAIVPADAVRDHEALVDLLRAERVTVLTQTPPAFRALRTTLTAIGRSFRDLDMRTIVFGGDALHVRELEQWFTEHGDAKPALVNMYGITETTVHTTYKRVLLEDLAATPSSPIGRALPDLRLYVLDERLEPVPIGVPGELFVAGHGLARGYLNRPGLTAQRFMPEPFSGTPGARMYRTGDQVRWLPDGTLEFLGRTDRQVKVRGYRIEPGEIEAAMLEHPMVGEAVVLPRTDQEGNVDLVGYLSVEPGSDLVDRSSTDAVEGWSEVFDLAFGEESDPFASWDSSYTGEPIPREAMAEWLDHAVAQIAESGPRRILDVGCGTGLFLRKLAPGCERYVGTDVSGAALAAARKQAELAGLGPDRVELRRQSADDLTGLAGERFDTILLDSIVQYFPSVDYLVKVLEGLIGLVEPGGRVFVGDVRHLGLLEAFHTSVERYRSDDGESTAALRARVAQRVGGENELLVDPGLFRRLPGVTSVDVRIKRGSHDTELERFRYDVVLRVGDDAAEEKGAEPREVPSRTWPGTVEAFRRWLADERPEIATVRDIPNARVADDLRAAAVLADPGAAPATVGDLAKVLVPHGVDPEEPAAVAEELGYRVGLRFSETGGPGLFDITVGAGELPAEPPVSEERVDWSRYANFCLRDRWEAEVVPALQAHLAERLPSHMVPARFVVLDRLPLNRSGKVDHGVLPPPTSARADDASFVAPRDETERLLASIWAEVLGLERVGVTDDFFGLGGDSLRSVQVVGRARAEGLELTARGLFEHPTIAELATVAQRTESVPTRVPLTTAQRLLRGGVWATLLESTVRLDPELLDAALAFVARRHDALRLTLVSGEWSVEPGEPRVRWLPRSDSLLDDAVADFDPATAVVRVVGTDPDSATPQRLALVVNRLALDERGVRILLAELGLAYRQLAAGAAIRLPDRPVSFTAWAGRQPSHAVEPSPITESTQVVELEPTAEQVAALTGPLATAYRMSPAEALLAAVTLGVRWSRSDELWVRRRDVAAGVGRFDVVVSLPAGGEVSPSGVKEQLRASSPLAAATVVVHLVDVDVADPEPLLRCADGDPVDRLGVDADVVLRWDGVRARIVLAGPAAEAIADDVELTLRRLTEHAVREDIGTCTPSDFPLAGLDQETLSRVFGNGRHIEDVYPVGPHQDWMLACYRDRREPSLYGFDLTWAGEDIDPEAWAAAWRVVVARQPNLRTGVLTEGVPRPLQVVHRDVPLRFEVEDWRHLDPQEQGRRWHAYMDGLYARGFDLAEPGHSRHALFRVGERTYWWTWFVNYLLFDGVSFYRAFHEAETVYRSIVDGRAADLPEVVPPARYIEWFEQRDLDPALAYWRERLAGFTTATPLVRKLDADLTAPRHPQRTGRSTMLSRRLSTALRVTARRHQLTLFSLVQAAWALLLHDTTGDTDVLFGNVVGGRPDEVPGAEQVVGYSNLHLPARVDVDPAKPLLTWLRELQATQVDDRAHQWSPLRRIKGVSEIPTRADLYQSCLFFMDGPLRAAPRSETWRRIIGGANTEHEVRVVVGPAETISLSLVYNKGTFSDDRMDLVLRKVCTALIRMSASLENSVADLLGALANPDDVDIIAREDQLLFSTAPVRSVADLTAG